MDRESNLAAMDRPELILQSKPLPNPNVNAWNEEHRDLNATPHWHRICQVNQLLRLYHFTSEITHF